MIEISKLRGYKSRLSWTQLVGIAVIILIFGFYCLGGLINITPSMPLGMYMMSRSVIKRGDTVALCLPAPYKTLGLKFNYIVAGTRCNGTDPIIKEVVALPGDHVAIQDDYIEVNNHRYFYGTKHVDSQGMTLTVYPRGDYPNTIGYWLIGTNDIKHSWDSRYWGPLEQHHLLYKIIPLLTW